MFTLCLKEKGGTKCGLTPHLPACMHTYGACVFECVRVYTETHHVRGTDECWRACSDAHTGSFISYHNYLQLQEVCIPSHRTSRFPQRFRHGPLLHSALSCHSAITYHRWENRTRNTVWMLSELGYTVSFQLVFLFVLALTTQFYLLQHVLEKSFSTQRSHCVSTPRKTHVL